MPKGPFTVNLVPAEHGTYTVSPQIPADGKLPAGTRLQVTASPAEGYSLDAVYYTVEGGMWGVTHYESFTPEMDISLDTNMWVGANFIDNALVEKLEVTQDVLYAQPGKKPLKYDVFAPKGAKNLPCIVIIHGGGWSSNNEDIMRGLARELARGNQYVVFSIDYRWINHLDGDEQPNHMHHLIEDVFGAIAHIQTHAKKYGGDPRRIAVTGDSAGGHLSACAAVLCPFIGEGGFGEQQGVYEFMPSYLPEGKTLEQVREEIT
ncbi:MAG: alpha/beta hydrolase, partial [Bacteroidetes bacterium]